MSAWQSWMFWPENLVLSLLAWVGLLMLGLYVLRRPVHIAVRALTRSVHHLLRLAARWVSLAAGELRERNRLVLLAHGREELGRRIERQFERVDLVVRRDLHGYPALQRRLLDEIARLEDEYRQHGEVPPTPPEWTKVLIAIAKVKPGADPVVKHILSDIQKTVSDAHDVSIREYRKAYEARHKRLGRLLPFWRATNQTLASFDKNVAGLLQRASVIDANIEKYQQLERKTELAERALTVSATIQFVLAILVLIGAGAGMAVNFSLIAFPISEVVDTNRYIGRFPIADVAAFVITALEVMLGILLMEALRVTHLFPRISYLSERMRKRLVGSTLGLLLLFAAGEIALALIHSKITGLPMVHSSLLTGEGDAIAVNAWLGLLLPFALAFVAIPLESFLYSLRTVTGALLVIGFRTTAFGLRFLGSFARELGLVFLKLYDGIIFLPLGLEGLAKAFVARVAPRRSTQDLSQDQTDAA